MDNQNQQRTYFQIGVGWMKKNKKGEDYISASSKPNTNPKFKGRNAKLFAELDNGETVQVESFAVYFNEKEEGSNGPDVRFVFSTN